MRKGQKCGSLSEAFRVLAGYIGHLVGFVVLRLRFEWYMRKGEKCGSLKLPLPL